MARCLECGKEVEAGTSLCFPICNEPNHTQTHKQFDDFFDDFELKLIPLEAQSTLLTVKHLKPEDIGMRIPTWQEEAQRLLTACFVASGPQCLADYVRLAHRIAIDKRITFWNGLVITVYFFRREWCIKQYYDQGVEEDLKKGIKERLRGWKLAIFNPFDFLEWAMPGFAKWINVTMANQGYTRKMLVAEAERVIHDETMLACVGS
jgi:hypothetical protein